MARQDVVRALVPHARLEQVLDVLTGELGVDPQSIEISEPEAATYRQEGSNREVHRLVRAGWPRVVVGALVGGVLGAVVAWFVPALRELAPMSVLLLAFGFGWGASTVMAARGVQVARSGDDRGEELHHVDPAERREVGLLVVRDLRERSRIEDHLAEQGVLLLDSDYPRVGRRGPGRRPADRGVDEAGPPAR